METEVIDPHWSLFEPPVVNKSTVRKQYLKYDTDTMTINSGNNQLGTNYKLRTKDMDQYLLPAEGYLLVRFKIILSAGKADNDATVITTLINNGLHLFDKARYLIGGNEISSIDYPGWASTITLLRDMSKDTSESVSELSWWYPEDSAVRLGGHADGATNAVIDTNPTFAFPSNADRSLTSKGRAPASIYKYSIDGTSKALENISEFYNESYHKRFLRSHSSQEVELCIPLSSLFPFLASNRQAIRGMTHEIQLNKNQDYGHIIHSANGVGAMETLLTKIELHVPYVQPSLEVSALVESQLASNMASRWMWDEPTVFISDEYTANEVTWRVGSESNKPVMMAVFFQFHEQYTDQADASAIDVADASTGPTRLEINNGGIFSYLQDITNVEARVNSVAYPQERYELSFQNEQHSRSYIDMLRAGGKWGEGATDALLTKEQYRSIYPAFYFDLSQSSDLYENVKQNDIQVRWKITAGGLTYRAVCVLYTERSVSVKALDGRFSMETS